MPRLHASIRRPDKPGDKPDERHHSPRLDERRRSPRYLLDPAPERRRGGRLRRCARPRQGGGQALARDDRGRLPARPGCPRRGAARLRHHAGALGHVPAEGLPGRPLERRGFQAGVLGRGPACRRGAHPEPGQPVHERRARRRRGVQGGQRPQPRLQHQGRPGLPHGLVRRGGAALPPHREGRRREPRREHDRGGRGAGAPPPRPAGGAQAALLPPLPGLAGPSAAAVLRVPDHRQRPRALRDAGQPQEHRRRRARLPGSCRASRPSSGRRSTCSRRSWPTRAGASACSSSRATCSSSTTTRSCIRAPRSRISRSPIASATCCACGWPSRARSRCRPTGPSTSSTRGPARCAAACAARSRPRSSRPTRSGRQRRWAWRTGPGRP